MNKEAQPLPPLLSYSRNITSQNGEDGIIEEINTRLNIKRGHFVEFGAWDGKYLSNTYTLSERGWSGVYIEADDSRFKDLQTTCAAFDGRVEPMHALVDLADNRLDILLPQTKTPRDFDLLSIDVDGYDWQTWYLLTAYHPKIVIIEGNTSITPGIWQVHEEGLCQGSSFTALLTLGMDKGYCLVCHTGNLIFVRNDLISAIRLHPQHLAYPHTLFNYGVHLSEINYLKSQRRE